MMRGNFNEINIARIKTNKLWKLTKTLTRVIGPIDMALEYKTKPINPLRTLKKMTIAKLCLRNDLEKFFLTVGRINKES